MNKAALEIGVCAVTRSRICSEGQGCQNSKAGHGIFGPCECSKADRGTEVQTARVAGKREAY